MQTMSGDSNCTQLFGKISSSLLSHPPFFFIYWPSLSTTADVHLFVQMLQLLVFHTVVRRHVSCHNLKMHSETVHYEHATWWLVFLCTLIFLLQKVREKIGQTINWRPHCDLYYRFWSISASVHTVLPDNHIIRLLC